MYTLERPHDPVVSANLYKSSRTTLGTYANEPNFHVYLCQKWQLDGVSAAYVKGHYIFDRNIGILIKVTAVEALKTTVPGLLFCLKSK